ncbi:MAG: hypothetical protein AAFW68_04215 [Pseudomonadota bacterium]
MARQKQRRRPAKKQPPVTLAEARIENIGARGDGVAIVDEKPVYAPLTAPGDEVRLSCRGDRGVLEEILKPSPHRAAPPCRYFGNCGGCALQHVTDDFYRDWKRQLVIDALSREGFDENIVAPMVFCPPASRRRARFAVRRTSAGIVFGFNARASLTVIDVDDCAVLAPDLNALLPRFRALAAATPHQWRRFDMAVTLCDNGVDIEFVGDDAADDLTGAERLSLTDMAREAGVIRLCVDGAPVVSFDTPIVAFGGIAVAPPPGGFLQASQAGEDALVRFVTSHVKSAAKIADLFSGCGTFTFPMSAHSAVHAVDGAGEAISALEIAARNPALRHPVTAARRNLFDRPLTVEELASFDAVVFDPPRAGARAQATELAQSNVPTIVGVSCNPASFARDASILRAGGYVLSQVLPVDQFVYAPHVEIAGVFQKE